MSGLFWNSFLAFLAGILLNFTPCVLPVIPFKIQAVLKEISGNLQSRILAALSLLAGSLVFFIILGGATAYLGLTWGALFQSKIFLVLLSVFLLFSALATFFEYSFKLPQLFYNVPIHRYLGAFLTGGLAGILSTPCSGPFLGSVLAYTVTQPPMIIVVIFTSIGIGLAFPYVLILLMPGLLKKISYTRPWAIQIKYLLAFVLLGGSFFFAQVFTSELVQLVFWAGLVGAIIIWCLKLLIRSKSLSEMIIPITTITITSLLIISSIKDNSKEGLEWKTYSHESLKNSMRDGRPILLEFTANWCLNCKVLEKTTYSDKEVVNTARKLKLLSYRVDMTDFDEEQKKLLKHYGGTALPFAVLINVDGKITKKFSGMFSVKTLMEAIEHIN